MIRVTALLVALLPIAAFGHVYSSWEVNGGRLAEGHTAEQIRSIAGDPLRIDTGPNGIGEHWVYLCESDGTGPCKTVAQNGEREMILWLVGQRLMGFPRFRTLPAP